MTDLAAKAEQHFPSLLPSNKQRRQDYLMGAVAMGQAAAEMCEKPMLSGGGGEFLANRIRALLVNPLLPEKSPASAPELMKITPESKGRDLRPSDANTGDWVTLAAPGGNYLNRVKLERGDAIGSFWEIRLIERGPKYPNLPTAVGWYARAGYGNLYYLDKEGQFHVGTINGALVSHEAVAEESLTQLGDVHLAQIEVVEWYEQQGASKPFDLTQRDARERFKIGRFATGPTR